MLQIARLLPRYSIIVLTEVVVFPFAFSFALSLLAYS